MLVLFWYLFTIPLSVSIKTNELNPIHCLKVIILASQLVYTSCCLATQHQLEKPLSDLRYRFMERQVSSTVYLSLVQ